MLRAHFLNQGRVDSILLECDGEYAFIDGGYRRNGERAVSYLRSRDITRLRYYIASHGHKNHIGAAAAIIGAFTVDEIIVGRAKVLDSIIKYAETPVEMEAIKECTVTRALRGYTFKLGNADICCIGPNKQKSCSCGAYSENYNSLILRVDYEGSGRLLLTGDSTASIIAECENSARANVLKSPHHAGTQPLSLLKQVKPSKVVICSNVGAGRKYRNRINDIGASAFNVCDGRVVIDI